MSETFEKLTQEQLQEILLSVMVKGNESNDINVTEVVEDIKQQVLMAMMK